MGIMWRLYGLKPQREACPRYRRLEGHWPRVCRGLCRRRRTGQDRIAKSPRRACGEGGGSFAKGGGRGARRLGRRPRHPRQQRRRHPRRRPAQGGRGHLAQGLGPEALRLHQPLAPDLRPDEEEKTRRDRQHHRLRGREDGCRLHRRQHRQCRPDGLHPCPGRRLARRRRPRRGNQSRPDRHRPAADALPAARRDAAGRRRALPRTVRRDVLRPAGPRRRDCRGRAVPRLRALLLYQRLHPHHRRRPLRALRQVKAVVCREYGPPDSLVVEELPSPEAGPGEVVVTMKAASVNFPDVLIIQNKYQFKPPLPFSPGSELAGVVKQVGSGVTGWKPGDKVIAFTTYGAFAEEVKTEASRLVALPKDMSFESGAAFLLTYATSDHALRDRGALRAGETLLVLGAAGGVGLAAIEIGKALGARVIACASSDDNLAVW